MNLSEIRKKIDRIDRNLIKILHERNALMSFVIEEKLKEGLPIDDKERERVMIGDRKKRAKSLGVSEEYVENIFREVIQEGKRIQQKIKSQNHRK